MYIWNFKGFLNELEGATFQKRIFLKILGSSCLLEVPVFFKMW